MKRIASRRVVRLDRNTGISSTGISLTLIAAASARPPANARRRSIRNAASSDSAATVGSVFPWWALTRNDAGFQQKRAKAPDAATLPRARQVR